jgi:hypothetical protein
MDIVQKLRKGLFPAPPFEFSVGDDEIEAANEIELLRKKLADITEDRDSWKADSENAHARLKALFIERNKLVESF